MYELNYWSILLVRRDRTGNSKFVNTKIAVPGPLCSESAFFSLARHFENKERELGFSDLWHQARQ